MRVEELFTPLCEIKATMPQRAEVIGNAMVKVDVDKFDRMWKKSDPGGNFYISPGGTGAAIKGRYPRFIEFVKSSQSYEVPEVHVGSDGKIGFTNGRHRFSVLRDQGHKILPVAMNPEAVENAKKYGLISMTEQSVNEGVPNPKKLLQALKTFIELASTRDLHTAFAAMEEMGLNPLQIKQVHVAYEKFKGAREAKHAHQ